MTKTELNFNDLPSELKRLIFDKNRQAAQDQRYRQNYDDVMVGLEDAHNEGYYNFLDDDMTRPDRERWLEEFDEIFFQPVWYRQ